MRRAKQLEHGGIPRDAVLLIPDPECQDETPTCGVQPVYYNSEQMLDLVEKHMNDAEAIHFIADMLETGDAENDGFAELLRNNHQDPSAIARINQICRN
jgi:hypothetical protein